MPETRAPLSEDDIRAICGREIAAAESHVEPLASDRMKALDYYLGKGLPNAKKGQSSVVSREVMDTIEWVTPSLLKIFTSSDEVVRFDPVGPEDEQVAAQATDFVNLVWNRDNPGFVTMATWFKDALLNRLGVIKIWWEDGTGAHVVYDNSPSSDDIDYATMQELGGGSIVVHGKN